MRIVSDSAHSLVERRWRALGLSLAGRPILLVFTQRGTLIRVIGAPDFWATADSTDYIDWSTARAVRFPNHRPSSTAISVRLPDTLLTELKLLNNERDVPIKVCSHYLWLIACVRSGVRWERA